MKKAKNNRKHSNPAKRWKRLVLAAQAGNKLAIKILCKAFLPLIKKEAHRPAIIQVLGEDAKNTAWMLFLDFIMNYHDQKFLVLPGVIKKYLHYELIHIAYPRTKNSVEAALWLDETDKEGQPLHHIASDELVDNHINDSKSIQNLLKHLTPKQREVIEATILGSQTLDEYRLQHGLTFTTVYLHQQRGLKRLKKVIMKSKENAIF